MSPQASIKESKYKWNKRTLIYKRRQTEWIDIKTTITTDTVCRKLTQRIKVPTSTETLCIVDMLQAQRFWHMDCVKMRICYVQYFSVSLTYSQQEFLKRKIRILTWKKNEGERHNIPGGQYWKCRCNVSLGEVSTDLTLNFLAATIKRQL